MNATFVHGRQNKKPAEIAETRTARLPVLPIYRLLR